MVDFYNTNALLAKISQIDSFFVPDHKSWLLLYSDQNYKPILQLNVSAAGDETLATFPKLLQTNGGNLRVLNENEFELNWWGSHISQLFDGNSLYEEFFKLGIVEKSGISVKPFNRYSSSYYHIWQSNQKFIGGVTDVDAIRFDASGRIIEIIEVKRSRIPISKWWPYANDRGGYEILDLVSHSLGVKFSTVYYYFDPSQQIEEIGNLLILEKQEGFKFKSKGVFSLEAFENGEYL